MSRDRAGRSRSCWSPAWRSSSLAVGGPTARPTTTPVLRDRRRSPTPRRSPAPRDAAHAGPAPRSTARHLDWSALPTDGDQCATLTVPLDYHAPRPATTIELALLKVPAADPGARIGSLVVNPGGPGEPGTTYAAPGARRSASRCLDALRHRRLRPARHRRQSDPVDCLSDAELDAYLAGDPDPDTAGRGRGRSRQRSSSSATGCSRLRRPGLPRLDGRGRHATWTSCAPRSARATLNYLGASYGTKLGATYAELFPDQVGRFVLDGAVDLDARHSAGHRRQQAAGFETALALVRRRTASTRGGCFLGDTVRPGARDDQHAPRRDRPAAAAASRRPRADRGQRVLRHGVPPSTAGTTGSCSTRRSARRSAATARS